MSQDTFWVDFSSHLALVTGFALLFAVSIWLFINKIMVPIARKDIAAAKTQERKDYLYRELFDFQGYAKKARRWAILIGICFVACLVLYFKYKP